MDRFQTRAVERTSTAYDQGLRSFLQGVYNTMAMGLVVTGLVSWGAAQSEAFMQMLHTPIIHLIVALSPLAIILFGFTPSATNRMSVGTMTGLFFLISALIGLSISSIFMVYSSTSIARVFFITSGMFAATALYGNVTRRDLTGLGSLMTMGLIGIILATLVNLVIGLFTGTGGSSGFQFLISCVSVVVFTGLTAWEAQFLKETYAESNGRENNAKLAIHGALNMYLNFINLFMTMLRLFGSRD